MERAAWTDERLDDLAGRMDSGFGQIRSEVSDLRAETRRGFDRLGGRIDALQVTLMRVGGGVIVGLVGVIAAVLVRG